MNKEIKNKLKKEIHRHLVRNNLEPSFYLAVVEQYENDDCFANLFYEGTQLTFLHSKARSNL